jgi:hypothetical protein
MPDSENPLKGGPEGKVVRETVSGAVVPVKYVFGLLALVATFNWAIACFWPKLAPEILVMNWLLVCILVPLAYSVFDEDAVLVLRRPRSARKKR